VSCLIEQVYLELFKFIVWSAFLLSLKESHLQSKFRWLSSWLFPIGFLVTFFAWDEGVHAAHFTFIGSYILFVMLHRLEKLKDWVAWSLTGLIMFAMLTRLSASFMAESYFRHLAYGAIVLIVAVAVAIRAKKT
jgi:hypothetical protein